MRGNLLCASVLLAVLLILCPVGAQTTETTIEFSESQLLFSNSNGFDLVSIDSPRGYLDGVEGEPMLPVVTANILMPAGAKITGVRTNVEKETELAGQFNIMPTQKIVPTGAGGKSDFVKPNPAVYSSSKHQREKALDGVARKIMRGHYIAGVKVYPVDYVPSSGKLILRNKIRIYVDYDIDAKNVTNVPSRKHAEFEQMVRDSVLNPAALGTPAEGTQTAAQNSAVGESGSMSLMDAPTDTVEYLIITKDEFANAFGVLADWKTKKGVPAEVVTLSWVYSNYSGNSLQQRVKSCIRDYVLNKGTLWVVLGADVDGILAYGCYSTCAGYVDYSIPADLYYSDIDVINWDGDGNGIPGQLTDGVDMGPDVFVGRISVSSAAEAAAYINKAVAYEKNSPATNFAEKLLMCGVKLFTDINGVSDAEATGELMWSSQIDPNWWGTRYRFYDTNTDFAGGASYDVTPAHMNDQINNGYNFIHPHTHGNNTEMLFEGSTYYNNDSVSLLTNSGKYTNILSGSCYTNAFDDQNYICLGEGFIRKANAGAVSYIGASRYGWDYYNNPQPGPSGQFNQTFYCFLFRNLYGNHIGEVLARTKESKLPINQYDGFHWLEYALNLLGDPELPLYTANPQTMSPVYSSQINTGSQTYVVNTGVAGAKVCLMKHNEAVYVYGDANASGVFSAQINPSYPGIMDITITAMNRYPYEAEVNVGPIDSIPPSPPAGVTATPATNQVNLDWANNTETDLMNYNVYRATATGGPYACIAQGLSDSNFTDTLYYGITYYYRVTAIDYSENESNYSGIASAAPIDTIAPAAPQNFYASSAHMAVSTWWSNNNSEPDFKHYNLYRSVNGGAFAQIAEVNTASYSDTNVALGNTYTYYVKAEDLQGNQSSASNQGSGSPTQLLVVTNLVATAGDARVTLNWDSVNDTNLWFYVVERSLTSGSGYQIAGMQSTNTMVDNGLVNGTTYYYHVSAVNNQGQGGPYSNEASATPHAIVNPDAPAAPTNLTAVAGDNQVTLDWSDNNEADLSHYNVYRSTTSGCCWNLIYSSAVTSSYVDHTASNGTTYYYTVTAVDTNNNESVKSNEASAMPVNTAPAVPTGLTATAGDRSVALDWSDNTETDLRGYNVYRSLTSGSGYTSVATNITVSNFTDNTVTNGTRYYYVVTSVDTGGLQSGYSSEVSALPRDYTPPAAPTGLVATAGNKQVSLDWNNNSESDMSYYIVYRSTTNGGPYSQITTRTTSDYNDVNLTNGTTYYYVIKAVDTSTNQSANSSQVSATPQPPAPVTYYPSSYTVTTGSYVSGNLASLRANDNNYMVIKSQTSGTTRYARTDFTVTGIAGGTYTRIDLQVISKSDKSSTTQKIYLYNYVTAAWDQKDSTTISTSEVTRNVAVTSGMTNYISGGQLKIRTEGYKTNSTTIQLSHEVVYAKVTW
jgi:fibronectin type 3 domain-containing protein